VAIQKPSNRRDLHKAIENKAQVAKVLANLPKERLPNLHRSKGNLHVDKFDRLEHVAGTTKHLQFGSLNVDPKKIGRFTGKNFKWPTLSETASSLNCTIEGPLLIASCPRFLRQISAAAGFGSNT
jgi:hypothetical protein